MFADDNVISSRSRKQVEENLETWRSVEKRCPQAGLEQVKQSVSGDV